VGAQLRFTICKETGVELDTKHWYEHVPKSVGTSRGGKVTILWNQQIQTDRTIPSSKPDIAICDNEKGTRLLTDVAIKFQETGKEKVKRIILLLLFLS
jgi:hypothetical protein